MGGLNDILTSVVNALLGMLGFAGDGAFGGWIASARGFGGKKGKQGGGRISGHSISSGFAGEMITDYKNLNANNDYKQQLKQQYAAASYGGGGSQKSNSFLSRGQKIMTKMHKPEVQSKSASPHLRRSGRGGLVESRYTNNASPTKTITSSSKPNFSPTAPKRVTPEHSVRKFIRTK